MLAVFRRDMNHPADPVTPKIANSRYTSALNNGYLFKQFAKFNSPFVMVKLGKNGYIAYSTKKGLSPNPRPMFCIRDGIYCICRCSMKMMEERKKAGENGNVSDLLAAFYIDLIKQGSNNPFEAMQQSLDGDYNYILYDSLANQQNSVRRTVAVHCSQDTPFYYGLDSDGYCIIADSFAIIGKVCGELQSIKDIPKGYVLKIPVLMEARPEEVIGSSCDYLSLYESAGESSEANPFSSSSITVPVAAKDELTEAKTDDGTTSMTANGGQGGPVEATSSGCGDSIEVEVEPKGDDTTSKF